MPFLSGYSQRKLITIDNAEVDGDLSDFPIFITFTDSDIGANIDAQGFNIRFTEDDAVTLLAYERQSFEIDGPDAIGAFWVKVPAISASSGAEIYIYYEGGIGVDGEDPENVWDSDYVGVWHLEQDPSGTILDSRGVNDLTVEGSMGSGDLIAGTIGNGLEFDGINDRLTSTSPNFDLTGDLTLEAWGQIDQVISDESIFHKWSGGNGYTLQSNGPLFLAIGTGGGTAIASTTTVLAQGTYYYMCGTFNGSTLQCYLDGVPDGSPIGQSGLDNSGNDIAIANRSDGDDPVACQLDEIRISSIARAAEWIKFTHHNIDGNVYTLGAEETDGVTGSGGAVAGGSCNVQKIIFVTVNGGSLVGSSFTVQEITVTTGSGGSLGGGSLSAQESESYTMLGGGVVSGLAGVNLIYSVGGVGGCVVGGYSEPETVECHRRIETNYYRCLREQCMVSVRGLYVKPHAGNRYLVGKSPTSAMVPSITVCNQRLGSSR